MGIDILNRLGKISKLPRTILPADETTINFVYLNSAYYFPVTSFFSSLFFNIEVSNFMFPDI